MHGNAQRAPLLPGNARWAPVLPGQQSRLLQYDDTTNDDAADDTADDDTDDDAADDTNDTATYCGERRKSARRTATY